MVLIDAKLSLWSKKTDTAYEMTAQRDTGSRTEQYNLLKQMSHIPVLIMSMLQPIIEQQNTVSDKLPAINAVFDELSNVLLDLDQDKEMLRHKQIVSKSLWLLERTKTATNTHGLESLLRTYLRDIHQDLHENSRLAAEAQINSLNIVAQWIKTHQIDLNLARVLIVAPHGPRNGLIEQQYFEKLFAHHHLNNQMDDRIFYVEMLPKDISKIDIPVDLIENFLGSCELNKRIGQWAFDNSKALFSDVLHEHAKDPIEALLQKDITSKSKCPFSFLKNKV